MALTDRYARRVPVIDLAASLGALALVLVAHQVGPILRQPYWLDEAWVAASAKAPVADLPWVSASSPLGWTLLVSALPAYGQIHRLIPLGFLAGSVLAAYALGRALGWPGRAWSLLAGLAAAAAVLLLPAQFLRHDLKQYTADAAVTLTLLAMAAWTEATWSRRRMTALGASVVGGMLISHAAAFAGAAVLGGLLIAAIGAGREHNRREHSGREHSGGKDNGPEHSGREDNGRAHSGHMASGTGRGARVRDAGALAAGTGAGMAAVYLLTDRTGRTPQLSAYWSPYFPAPRVLPGYLVARLDELRPALGLPWPLLLALAAAGVVTAARTRRPGTAAALAVLPVIAIVAGLTRRYPLLDQRTSHFLLVTAAAAAGVGLTGLAAAVTVRMRWPGRGMLAGGLVALTVAAFAVANRGTLIHPVPPGVATEDIRSQVAYVAAHRAPGDVILVNLSGQYGFAYYWSAGVPRWHTGGVQATGWYVDYPPPDRIVVATDRDPAGVARAVATAERLSEPDGRIWLIRTHVNESEAQAWRQALAGRPVSIIAVGVEPVTVLTTG